VKPVCTALPKLNPVWNEHITSPVRRPWHFFSRVARFQFFPLLFQFDSIPYNLALPRHPRPEAASPRTASKVGIGFRFRNFFHPARHTHLSFQLRPIKHQCCLGIFHKLLPFAAVVIREKNKPSLVHALQQDHAGGWPSGFVRRGQRHRADIWRLRSSQHHQRLIESHEKFPDTAFSARSSRILEPSLKLLQRVR